MAQVNLNVAAKKHYNNCNKKAKTRQHRPLANSTTMLLFYSSSQQMAFNWETQM